MKKLAFLWCWLWALAALGGEVIPPAPTNHFNDFANVVSAGTATKLDQKLVDFERSTSSQIVVAIYPKMLSDSSIEDYTVRVAQSWQTTSAGKKNCAVLFVFIQDRKLYIQVGYGLEGALPDALCKRIISTEIEPRFKAGDYNGGLTAGVDAILSATKGEYKGTGMPVHAFQQTPNIFDNVNPLVVFGIIVLALVGFGLIGAIFGRKPGRHHGWVASSGGWSGYSGGGWSSGGGFSSGGGGSSSGGGGDFSGFGSGSGSGGSSFGGGGAGGSW